jgi:hypothetical protein
MEETTQKCFHSKLFLSEFTFLPLGDASVCSEKMAAPRKKSFCVLEYHTSKSVVTVQRAFCAKHAKDTPKDKSCDLADIKARIIAAVKNIDAFMLTRVKQEFEYCIDLCSVTRGAHCEHL